MRALMLLFAGAALVAQAQTKSNDLGLRGDRFKPLTADQLTPEQKTMVDHLMKGERAGLNGPFNVLLRSPEMGDVTQKLGAYLRFHTSIPKKLNEMAILITARTWTSQYEWFAHHAIAMKAGLDPQIAAAIAEGRKPKNMKEDEAAVWEFSTQLHKTKKVSDAAYKRIVGLYGEQGAMDLIGVLAYYTAVSMTLNVAEVPVPAGEKNPLKPLK